MEEEDRKKEGARNKLGGNWTKGVRRREREVPISFRREKRGGKIQRGMTCRTVEDSKKQRRMEKYIESHMQAGKRNHGHTY